MAGSFQSNPKISSSRMVQLMEAKWREFRESNPLVKRRREEELKKHVDQKTDVDEKKKTAEEKRKRKELEKKKKQEAKKKPSSSKRKKIGAETLSPKCNFERRHGDPHSSSMEG